jgi:transcriptional regulator GlxA family with amidase domain
MKSITILVPDGENNLSSIVGAYKILSRANKLWMEAGKAGPYTIQLAGISPVVDFHGGLFSVRPHMHISDIDKTDLVIIPSLNHEYEQTIAVNQHVTKWIKAQYDRGAEIASICTGAFLLATSGILEGKSCGTHWAFADKFKTMFPGVDLQRDRLITDEHGIYTNGGAYSFLNLIIYLVEKYFDRQTAIFCSKIFQIDVDRDNQSQFIIFKGQREHEDELIKQAQVFLENNFQQKVSIETLSAKFAVGRRNFDRRFIKATGNTPVEYAQRVKVEAAKRAFESSHKTVGEVMLDVGYSDHKAFREVFRRITGVSPLAYRTKYHKD